MASSEDKWCLVILFGALVIVLTQNPENDYTTKPIDIIADGNCIIIDVPELGQLKGAEDETSWTKQKFIKFLGIPFAEPPINKFRFKPPVPLPKWQGIKDATKFGKRCPALIDYIPLTDQKFDLLSEDCLNLCVYTKDVNKQRPVMVYIHGGALWNGTAIEHPGHFLLEKDIVYVAVQYRLGALGFISTQSPDIPGNMGILDVKLALEWVHKNIKYFGGNPDDVTVFGESAGAAITSLLMISPIIPQNLFQKAIIQSGSVLMAGIYDNEPLENARITCKKLECTNCENVNEINNCLKKAHLSDLLKIGNESYAHVPYGITINDFGGVLPKKAKQLLMESSKKYQVMTGVQKHDGAFLLAGLGQPKDTADYIETLINYLGEADDYGTIANLAMKLYVQPGQLERADIEELMPAIIDIASTIQFKSPTQKFIELYTKKHSNENNYLYTMNYVGNYHYLPYITKLQNIFPYYPFIDGVHHADDLLYLFPTRDLNENDTEMAKTMIDLWTSFAINGKPKVKNGPEILPIKNGKGPYFHINKKITIGDDFSDEFIVSVNEKNV